MNIRIQVTPELRVRLAHTDCLVVELPPEISTALEGREELMKSLTAADVPTDGEALRVERDLLSAKCDEKSAQLEFLKALVTKLTNGECIAIEGQITGYVADYDWLNEVGEALDYSKNLLAAHDAEVAAKAVTEFIQWATTSVDPEFAEWQDFANTYAAQLRAKAGE